MRTRNNGQYPASLRPLRIGVYASVLALAACGGDGGGDDEPETFLRSGQAINGYLVDAQVCIDSNLNGTCDEGEASTTSEFGNGAFQLETENPGGSVLVVANAGETEEFQPGDGEDDGTAVDEDFDLLAPAGAATVTPLTTLAHEEYVAEINSIDGDVTESDRTAAREAARDSLASDLSALDIGDFDLLDDDYLDADSGNSEVSTTANAVGRILRTAVSDTRNAVSGEGGDPDSISSSALVSFAASRVRENLADVAEAVEAGSPEDDIVGNNQPTIEADDEDGVTTAVESAENELEEAGSELEEIDEGEDDEEVTGATGGSGSG